MGLKIKTEGEGENLHINPETLEMLLRFSGHRDVCDECLAAIATRSGHYCATGRVLLEEILDRPDVEFFND